MKKTFLKLSMLVGLILPYAASNAQVKEGLTANAEEPEAIRDARMRWFRDAHFGMFVHWGLYSGAAGEWDGKDYDGCVEWIQNMANVPADVYEARLKPLFKPKKDFAREWAKTAKDAGCRYVIFTSRHHEGFALHDSKTTTFDGMDVTGRDLFREIVNALHEQGLRVGVYFSLVDWHHPDAYVEHGLPAPAGVKNDTRDNAKYVEYMHKQAEEMFSNYGPIDVVWWDYSSKEIQGEKWGAKDLVAMVKKHHPNIIMNNRLYAFEHNSEYTRANGDLVTPEQFIPESGFKGMDWESCMTMNGTWGYSKNNQRWHTETELVHNMIDIVSKGGNYLLNVGPMADGTIPAKSIDLMHGIGSWMNVNGEAIYGSRANTIGKVNWGRITTKPGKFFLHVFNWPENNKLHVPFAPDKGVIPQAYFLADGSKTPLKVEANERGLFIDVSNKAFKNDAATVIALDVTGTSLVAQGIFPEEDGSFKLLAGDAILTGGIALSVGEQAILHSWTAQDATVAWNVNVTQPGKYKVILSTACTDASAGSKIAVSLGKTTLPGVVKGTENSWGAYKDWDMGTAVISKKGTNTILVKAITKPGLGVMNLKNIRLVPVGK
ncbi:alpha-L-fucosidase [Pedobacter foliorum]|uniref:alpha-L-fucosidase n=1 Tax=Pedobacter foliorum TaxID=2739058 RepID=UPI0015648B54|nr:alpha-L-fucosidase [Pedobacter foliorum]NRF41702.1 alpha-L-fucosidase [Pedobacter foliorum]